MLLTLVLTAAACGSAAADITEPLRREPSEPGIAVPDPVVRLTVSPSSQDLEVRSIPFGSYRLQGITRSGDRVDITGARWLSSDSNVAFIDSLSGVVAAVRPGVARITARWHNLTAVAEATVLLACGQPIWGFGPATMTVGERGQWRGGVCTPRAQGDTTITWSSSDSTIIRIDSTGLGVALRPGVVGITASNRHLGSMTVATVVKAADQ